MTGRAGNKNSHRDSLRVSWLCRHRERMMTSGVITDRSRNDTECHHPKTPYYRPMPRWEAGAEARLTRAAYELYFERGFEDVTVAEIAARAGLTKRTFFRYFADKREVLFSGAATFQDTVVDAVVSAPAGLSPIDAVIEALAAG